MRCAFGFNFTQAALEHPKPYVSFLVADNEPYTKFLEGELAVLDAKHDEKARLRVIARSATLTGSQHACPECGRLTFWRPGQRHKEAGCYGRVAGA